MSTCVVISDKHGVPSVIGPFNNVDEATKYANDLIDNGLDKVRIAQLNPPPID